MDLGGNDQERVPKKMNVLFLRKENVSEAVECVLDRSILERIPGFLERFFFLKKVKFFFGTRSIPFYSINIFHWALYSCTRETKR